jgi:hypothetical protein
MKKLFSTLLLLFAFVFFAQTTYSQGFPYHLYDPRTLAELVELNVIESKKLKDDGTKKIMISANPFYSAIRLEYAGKSRVIAKEKLNLFKIWQESLEVDSRLFSILDKEFLFKECGKEYWIPVQKPAANDFPEDFKSGDKITLYLMMVGGLEDKGNWDWVFFTNSFKIY